MLGHRSQRNRRGQIVALKPAHFRIRHAHPQPRILARTLGASAPARIACDVEHGRKGHGDTGGGGFLGRLARRERP